MAPSKIAFENLLTALASPGYREAAMEVAGRWLQGDVELTEAQRAELTAAAPAALEVAG